MAGVACGPVPAASLPFEARDEAHRENNLKVPTSALEAGGIKVPVENMSKSMDGRFVELDPGGVGTTVPYVYDLFIVCSNAREIEALKIEVH